MTALLQGYDLLIVLALVCLLFGASKLPGLARALGSASHEFKRGQEGAALEDATKEGVATSRVAQKKLDGDGLAR